METGMDNTCNQPRRWPALRDRLLANEPWLLHQGALVAKPSDGKWYWQLRFDVTQDGRTVHRAIYVGREKDSELLRRTRELLADIRRRVEWPTEAAGFVVMARALNRFLRRRVPRMARRRVTARTGVGT